MLSYDKNSDVSLIPFGHKNLGLSALLLVLLLTGCGKGTPTTVVLKPNQLGFSDALYFRDHTSGGLGGEAALARKPDEVVAGFERFYQSEPVRNIQHFYRGAVLFDLNEIGKLKSKVIDKATLTYKLRQSYVQDAAGKSPDFVNLTSCALELWGASEDWRKLVTGKGYAESAFPVDSMITALPAVTPGAATFSVDVTKVARDWLVTPANNFGLVLKGVDEKVIVPNNSVCASRYGDFTLTLNYTVFEP